MLMPLSLEAAPSRGVAEKRQETVSLEIVACKNRSSTCLMEGEHALSLSTLCLQGRAIIFSNRLRESGLN